MHLLGTLAVVAVAAIAAAEVAAAEAESSNVTEAEEYWVRVYLCENDTDIEKYSGVLFLVNQLFNERPSSVPIEVLYHEVDCDSETSMTELLLDLQWHPRWQWLTGVVAPGAGVRILTEMVPSVPVAVYDASLQLAGSARGVAPPAAHMAAALRALLARCGWRRLALLVDTTAFATALTDSLLDFGTLVVRKVTLAKNGTVLLRELRTLRELDARIFFVNTDSRTAMDILRLARRLDMTLSTGHVWILREWGGGLQWNSPTGHYTVSGEWRGEGRASVGAEGDAALRAAVRRGCGAKRAAPLPALASPLADAVMLLLSAVSAFLHEHTEFRHNLHSPEVPRLVWSSLDDKPVSGVVQKLKTSENGVEEGVIFAREWIGANWSTVLEWRVGAEGQARELFGGAVCDSRRVDGARRCLLPRGDAFAPRCADAAAAAALLLALLAAAALVLARRARRLRQRRRDLALELRLRAQSRSVAAELADYVVDRKALVLRHELGVGSHGCVRFAVMRTGGVPRAVAAKSPPADASAAVEAELLREACTLASLRHPHVVRLVGVCVGGGPPLLLMEYAFFGDLRGYLARRRHLAEGAVGEGGEAEAEAAHVSAEALTRLGREAAAALAYLCARRVVHRDVRAANCLVDGRRALRLADFGLARATGGAAEYASRRRGLFPVAWMAPESLARGSFSPASDVWALGVLLLELVTLGARPFGGLPPLLVLRLVLAGGRPDMPPALSPHTRGLLLVCWRRAPAERPTAAAVAAHLAAHPRALRPAPPHHLSPPPP